VSGVLAAVSFAGLAFVVHVAAAQWLVIVLPPAALLPGVLAGAAGFRWAVAVLEGLLVAAVVVTTLLGASFGRGGETDSAQHVAGQVLSEQRLRLWHEAFAMMQSHPVTGVGPDRFQVVSPTAQRHPDYRWTHNEFLQQGAEAGIPGLLLLSTLFLWAFGRLWTVERAGPITALSAAALAALGLHATIDYVMHFPAVPIIAAALAGVGMVARPVENER
jgi:O-antigen ligase